MFYATVYNLTVSFDSWPSVVKICETNIFCTLVVIFIYTIILSM